MKRSWPLAALKDSLRARLRGFIAIRFDFFVLLEIA
jgi:hypothetical protein